MLKELARNTKGLLLKRFGCDALTSKQFQFLVKKLKEIVHLNLDMTLHCLKYKHNLNLLSSLKHLKSLGIYKHEIPGPYLGTILDIIGNQLTHLEV